MVTTAFGPSCERARLRSSDATYSQIMVLLLSTKAPELPTLRATSGCLGGPRIKFLGLECLKIITAWDCCVELARLGKLLFPCGGVAHEGTMAKCRMGDGAQIKRIGYSNGIVLNSACGAQAL